MSTSGQRSRAERESEEVDHSSGDVPAITDETTTRSFVARRTVNNAAYIRLKSQLAAAIPEFELLVERSHSEGESWVQQARELLRMAVDSLREGELDESWHNLHSARRLEIYGLERLSEDTTPEQPAPSSGGRADDPRTELEVRAETVRAEALEKLSGWRREAVVELLCEENEVLADDVTGVELRAAQRILHEFHEDVHLLRSEHQHQFNQLVMMGFLSGLGLFALSLVDWLLDADQDGLVGLLATFLETPFGTGGLAGVQVTAPGFAVFVTVVGVMGASLFGMRSLKNRSRMKHVAQQINQLTVTGARAVIGAISALVLYFALQTPIFAATPLAGNLTAPSVMVVVGFAAGYNERMAPDVVAKVASLTDTTPPEKLDSEETQSDQ